MSKKWITNPQTRRSLAITGTALMAALLAAVEFRRMHRVEPLFPAPEPSRILRLSDYHPPLRRSPVDSPVYLYDSGVPGGTLLIVGGTHPNEPAAYLAAVTILENLRVEQGRVLVLPRANKSAFTHNDPQEAMWRFYPIETPHGPRIFRNGSRFTNPVHQWPDPSICINPPGVFWEEQLERFPPEEYPFMRINPGPYPQTMSGVDSRNLNRNFPGMPNGTLTEQLAFAIVTLIREEGVDLAIDYHEASPEYPTINVIVAHPRAEAVSAMAELYLSGDDVDIVTDPSSPRLRGLTHREWGDASDALAILMETANPAQGRLKGRTSVQQLVGGLDRTYHRATIIERRLNERLAAMAERREARGRQPGERRRRILFADVPYGGIPIEVRVGRHVQATIRLVEAFSDEYPEREIVVSGLPSHGGILAEGLGAFLHGPKGEPPTWKQSP